MNQPNPLSQGLRKRRQLLLVLPLLVLPFMTLAFWALGGGQQQSENSPGQSAAIPGINSAVPRAQSTREPENKMTLYVEADRLAAAGRQNRTKDFGRLGYSAENGDSAYENGGLYGSAGENRYGINDELNTEFNNEFSDADASSLKISQKLTDLQALLGRAESVQQSARTMPASTPASTPVSSPASDDRWPVLQERPLAARGPEPAVSGAADGLNELHNLKDMIAQSADINDSEETREINTMLDKILAIQRPQLQPQPGIGQVNARSGNKKGSGGNAVVTPAVKEPVQVPLLSPASSFGNTASGSDLPGTSGTADAVREVYENHAKGHDADLKLDGNGHKQNSRVYPQGQQNGFVSAFYDIDSKDKKTGNEVGVDGNASIAADIAQTQTLVSGATVKMRLKTPIIIHGRQIPKGSFIYGACQVTGERLKIDIRHLRWEDQLFSVQLKVFDLDGMEGIHIPGSITRKAAKQGADRGLGSVQMMSMDPSIAAQAATAGMETAKGLLSKKAKLIRVTVKAGYPILLLNSEGQ